MLENELDELDPVKVHAGELFGEALLATCYSISPNVHPKLISDEDNKISSPKRSKMSHPCPMKHQLNEGSSEVLDSPSQQMLPRYIMTTQLQRSMRYLIDDYTAQMHSHTLKKHVNDKDSIRLKSRQGPRVFL